MALLKDKKALITGGSTGIGAAIALEFARQGADVAITFVGEKKDADKLSAKISSHEREFISMEADATDFSEAGKVVSRVFDEFHGLDILVCNAGINMDSTIWKMEENEWDSVINVNLKGCFNYIRAVSQVFKNQKSGKIITISSINGLRGKFGLSNYSASKAGIIGLTKSVAKEMGRYNVNVNSVAPGFIETSMTASLSSEIREAAIKESVLGRLGKPEDVANLVLFLASDEATYITGQVIQVDGGQLI